MKITVECEGWKVRVSMTIDFVMGLRSNALEEESMSLLVRKPKEMKKAEVAILQEEDEQQMAIPGEGDSMVPADDTKMVQKYRYSRVRTPGRGIDIEVLRIPS